MSKKILWFNWKDIRHPEAGGAELVTHEMCKALIRDGFEVTLLTARYKNSSEFEQIDGVNIIRQGNGKLSHYPKAIAYYRKHLRNTFDIIIEEVNTIPYFLNFFKGKESFYFYYNQLAREVWFYQMRFPISLIGYLVEPIYTWVQSWFKAPVITISKSTTDDMCRFGFRQNQFQYLTMFTTQKPLLEYQPEIKESDFTVLFTSSLRPMKRPIEVFKAFKELHNDLPNAKLWICGGGDQAKLSDYAKANNFIDQVSFFGFISTEKKFELMQKATVLCSTSIKEGWGLIVTEANSMATPAIVYDVDGLRDASKAGGNWTVPANSHELFFKLKEVHSLFENDRAKYNQIASDCLESSRKYTILECYEDLKKILKLND